MRKFILIVSLLLVSGAAQAEQMRGLTLASSETPAQQSQTAAPQQQAPAAAQTQLPPRDVKAAAKPDRDDDRDTYGDDDRRVSPRNRDNTRDDDRTDHKLVRHHESAEHKARRIAARYGVYW